MFVYSIFIEFFFLGKRYLQCGSRLNKIVQIIYLYIYVFINAFI